MLELQLVHGSLLKKVMDAIKDLVDHANFKCSATGFSFQATDFSQVALVDLLLRSEGFDHFRCDRDITMGMSLKKLAMLLKFAGNDDIITIKAEDGSDTVTFMFESPTQDKIVNYGMRLIDIDCELLQIEEVEYHARVRMSSAEFSRICRDLSSVGDTVMISVTEEGRVQFSTSGDDDIINVLYIQNEGATIIEMNEPISLTFALRYLISFTKASPLSNKVTISLFEKRPVMVEYEIAEMGYVRYYLAPKIEEDDEETKP